MRRTTRILVVALAVVLLVIAARTAVAFARFHNVETNFESVSVGQSRATVVERLGKPNYHAGKCGIIHVPQKDCVTEYVYSHPFAPLMPDYYIVAFSADNKVIEADRWTSP